MEFDQRNVRACLGAFQHDLVPVRRQVEIGDVPVGVEVSQRVLLAGLEIHLPEILVRDIAAQEDERVRRNRKGLVLGTFVGCLRSRGLLLEQLSSTRPITTSEKPQRSQRSSQAERHSTASGRSGSMPLEGHGGLPHCRLCARRSDVARGGRHESETYRKRACRSIRLDRALRRPGSGDFAHGLCGHDDRDGDVSGEINVFNSVIPPDAWKHWLKSDVWLSWQKTKGNSDLYIQSNTWQVGATTGWHSHPGHSLIIITSGIVTDYESENGRRCTSAVYDATLKPQTLVDSGGNHIHQIVDTGGTVATGYTVQLIPSGANRQIDAAQPANCSF